MSQADFTDILGSASVQELRRQLNARGKALRTLEAGTSFPSSPHANQFAFRTDAGWVFQRNSANTAWVAMWPIDNGPYAPHVVEITNSATSPWVTSTEVATDPGAGVEDEGLDLIIVMTMTDTSKDFTVEIPDDADWEGRTIRIEYDRGLAGRRVIVERESDNTKLCEIDYPGDWVQFQVGSGGSLDITSFSLNGVFETTSNVTIGQQTNFWKTRFLLDCSSGNITVTLPAMPTAFPDVRYPIYLKKTDDSANPVIIYPDGSDKIEGASVEYLWSENDSVMLLPDHFNDRWLIYSEERHGRQEVSAASVTVDRATGFYLVDTSSNSVTLSLPDIATNPFEWSRPITFVKGHASNTMTIDTTGSPTINGAASVAKTGIYERVTVDAVGGNYYIVAEG